MQFCPWLEQLCLCLGSKWISISSPGLGSSNRDVDWGLNVQSELLNACLINNRQNHMFNTIVGLHKWPLTGYCIHSQMASFLTSSSTSVVFHCLFCFPYSFLAFGCFSHKGELSVLPLPVSVQLSIKKQRHPIAVWWFWTDQFKGIGHCFRNWGGGQEAF